MCELDGMFVAVVGEDSEHGNRTTASSIVLHPATGIASEVLAPNSPLRAAAVALAEAQVAGSVQAGAAQAESNSTPANGEAMGAAAGVPTKPEPIEPVQPKPAAHCLWAALIDRICEALPLLCPICAGRMRVIAFITYNADMRQILAQLGAQTEPSRSAPARGSRLWNEAHAAVGEGVEGMEPLPD